MYLSAYETHETRKEEVMKAAVKKMLGLKERPKLTEAFDKKSDAKVVRAHYFVK